MKFTTTFAVVACATVAQASTVASLLTDTAKINSDATNLNALIVAFPNTGGSLIAALAIQSALGSTVTDINVGTTDANNISPLPVSVADGTSIIAAFNNLKPVVITALTNIVAKKPAFVALPIAGVPTLIKSNLNHLSTAFQAFETALIVKVPAPLQASATSLKNAINSAFATAIVAYS